MNPDGGPQEHHGGGDELEAFSGLRSERGSREFRGMRERQRERNEENKKFWAFILQPKQLRFGLGEARVRVFSHGPPDPIAADPGSDPLEGHTRGTCNPNQFRPGSASQPGDASDDVTTALIALTAFGTAVGPRLVAF